MDEPQVIVSKKKGRPIGSKNKPKEEQNANIQKEAANTGN